MSTQSVMPSNHLILCHPLLLLPSALPSIRVFSNEAAFCISWPKYWSFSISPSNEYSGFISVRIDCFDLHAVQGTLKSLLQHQNLIFTVSILKKNIVSPWPSGPDQPCLWPCSLTATPGPTSGLRVLSCPDVQLAWQPLCSGLC